MPDDRRQQARRLSARADRFDELAEVAELMGDEDGARRLRDEGGHCRDQAMRLLD